MAQALWREGLGAHDAPAQVPCTPPRATSPHPRQGLSSSSQVSFVGGLSSDPTHSEL